MSYKILFDVYVKLSCTTSVAQTYVWCQILVRPFGILTIKQQKVSNKQYLPKLREIQEKMISCWQYKPQKCWNDPKLSSSVQWFSLRQVSKLILTHLLFRLVQTSSHSLKSNQENAYANFTVDSSTGWQGFRILPNITGVLIVAFCVFFSPTKQIYIVKRYSYWNWGAIIEYLNVSSLAF